MGYYVRKGDPSDYKEAAPLIYQSGPEVLEFLFARDGRTSLSFLEHSFQRGLGFFSSNAHYVVTSEDKVVSIGAFYGWFKHKFLSLGMAYDVFTFYPVKIGLSILLDCLAIESRRKPPGIFSLYICNFATNQDASGNGMATIIFNEVTKMKKYRFVTEFLCDVSLDNIRARKLHERTGFVGRRTTHFNKRELKPILRMSMPSRSWN